MSARDTLRKGWCPGALRPMQTGDGLLVRVKPRAGAFAIAELTAIAETAARCGSGEIDLTNRANLQLRGVSDATFTDAITALDAAGLIEVDAAIESVRNVMVDPLSGLDPDRADIRPLAANLERALAVASALHALPAKFGFSLSGAAPAAGNHMAADIVISARDQDHCFIQIDGEPKTGAVVKTEHAVCCALDLANAFLVLRERSESIRRMRDAVTAFGSVAVFNHASLNAVVLDAPPAQTPAEVRAGLLGLETSPWAVGIGLPFGRINASELSALCSIASNLGTSEVRPSPQRILIIPVTGASAARAILAHAANSGLITRNNDLRLGLDVCPGAPACRNATTSTRTDAHNVVAALNAARLTPASIHISGCDKGCARRTPAQITLVARNGAYDMIAGGSVEGAITAAGIAPQDLAARVVQTLAGQH